MFRVQTTRPSVSWNGETPYHEYFKNLSDEERVRFITSSPGLGTTLRVCHIYQAPKETVKVDWPECGLAFRKHDLWVHLVENNFGTVCFFPACDHRSRMRNNLYPTFTNTLIPPIWQKQVGNYIVLGQAAWVEKASYDKIVSYAYACANTKVRQGGVSSIKLPVRVDLRDIQQRMQSWRRRNNKIASMYSLTLAVSHIMSLQAVCIRIQNFVSSVRNYGTMNSYL